MNNPMYNLNGFMNSINQLKRSFNGNPQQYIQNMLNTGRITQDQYNRAVQTAQNIQSLMKRM